MNEAVVRKGLSSILSDDIDRISNIIIILWFASLVSKKIIGSMFLEDIRKIMFGEQHPT